MLINLLDLSHQHTQGLILITLTIPALDVDLVAEGMHAKHPHPLTYSLILLFTSSIIGSLLQPLMLVTFVITTSEEESIYTKLEK